MGKKILVIAILVLGLILRLHNYAMYPQRGASSDEYSYSFLGVSLLTRGIPETWSNVSGYKNKYDLAIRGIYFPMVNPYFDHPPLNGLLVGSWALINGQDTYEKITLEVIRLVPIALSFVSSILLYVLAKRVFGEKTALWALLIFETVTIFVMNQRVVFAENLVTPILLGALCLYFRKGKLTLTRTVSLAILSGLAIWAKEFGVIVFVSMLYFLIADRVSVRKVMLFGGIFGLFALMYIGYGYAYDGEVFWTIIGTQSDSRRIGPETLMFLFTTPVIVNKVYFDGWYFLGFLSLFLSFLDVKKYRALVAPSFLYLLLLIFSIDKMGEMGWYMIPLFPFMAIAIAAQLRDGIAKRNWYPLLLILFVGFYEIRYLFAANFGLAASQFRIFLFLMLVPPLLTFALKKEKLYAFLSHTWFYLLIAGTALLTFTYIHPA